MLTSCCHKAGGFLLLAYTPLFVLNHFFRFFDGLTISYNVSSVLLGKNSTKIWPLIFCCDLFFTPVSQNQWSPSSPSSDLYGYNCLQTYGTTCTCKQLIRHKQLLFRCRTQTGSALYNEIATITLCTSCMMEFFYGRCSQTKLPSSQFFTLLTGFRSFSIRIKPPLNTIM